MADTSFAVGDPLTVKRWSRILFEEVLKATVCYRFIGRDGNSLMVTKDELEKGSGDTINYGLRMQLTKDPHVGDSTLWGEEEQLIFYNDKLLIDLVRHGVRITNRDMTRQRVPYSVRDEARMGLTDYFEGLIDTWFFNHLCCYTPQTNVGWTGQNSPATVDAAHHILVDANANDQAITTAGASNANLFNITLIDNAMLLAKTLTPAIRPINVNGKKMFAIFIHPQQAEDMRTNTNTGQWYEIQKSLLQGGAGEGNAIFTDALGVYHNTIIIEDVRITNGVSSASTTTPVTTVRRAVFAGAQAGCIAFGRNEGSKGDKKSAPIYWREQMDDYEEQLGVSANLVGGLKAAVFNSAMFGEVVISTYSAT